MSKFDLEKPPSTRNLDPHELRFDCNMALKFLRMPPDAARSEQIREHLTALHTQLCHAFQPRFRYCILSIETAKAPDVVVLQNEITAFAGKAIYRRLARTHAAVLFCVTVGDDYAADMDGEDARFDAIFIDAVASTMVQAALKVLSNSVEGELKRQNFKLTPRISPGYPGWDLAEQAKLLDLLKHDEIGVHMSSTYFMTPQKSISGVFGIVPLNKGRL